MAVVQCAVEVVLVCARVKAVLVIVNVLTLVEVTVLTAGVTVMV